MATDVDQCPGCDNGAETMHSCPYEETIYDNFDEYCTCCAGCEQKCIEEIDENDGT